jgi:tetratricopeptide (TPR) repeat protein
MVMRKRRFVAPGTGERAVFDHIEGARHLPFFTELAGLEDGDATWRSVSAGLVVLRLVDAWIEEGAAAVAADGWGVRSVSAAIEEMPSGEPARALLRGVVEAVKTSAASDMHAIAPRLMAYARSLDLDAKWALAADVYETVLAHVHPVEESDVAITAHLRLGYCQRSMGALDDASRSYDAASAIAVDVDDMFGILRAQIGAAKIALARGNMPMAERLLEDTIKRAAARDDLTDVHAMALQDRADVAYHRGRYDLSVELAYASLELTRDPVNRDRLLGGIAGAFYMLGVRSAARDAYLIIEATTQEEYLRWSASINLMEIAARDGSMPLFERYRRSLATIPFPPAIEAQFHLQTAESYEALEQFDAATIAATRACVIAERFGFNQTLFAAEAIATRVRHGAAVSVRAPEAPVPESLRPIVTTISEMRRLVSK